MKQKIIDALINKPKSRMELVVELKESSAKIGAIVDAMLLSGDLLEEVIENKSIIFMSRSFIRTAEKPKQEAATQSATPAAKRIYQTNQNHTEINMNNGSIIQLNQILMQQLQRLANSTDATLPQEIERSRAISHTASELTKSHTVMVDVAKIQIMQGDKAQVSGLLS